MIPTEQQERTRAMVRATTAAYHKAQAAVEDRRTDQRQAIVAALDAGIRQVELVGLTGFTREHIRRISEEADDGDATPSPAGLEVASVTG